MNPGNEPLSDDDAALLAQALKPQWPAPERAADLRARILEKASPKAAIASKRPGLFTLRAGERQWQRVSAGVEMCTLQEDEHSRSILLKMQPGSFLLPHQHTMSEESLILEGDASVGDDQYLAAGDYHFSPAGALHPLLQSPQGCIVFVRGEKNFRPRVTVGLFRRLLRGITPRGRQ